MNTSQPNLLWSNWLNRWYNWLLASGILINLAGLFTTIIEPDGALYAGIAKTMAQSGDFINLKVEGKDWLDKPHFPFWMAAMSFKLFGINSFAYKFPALLFWAAGAFYTYRLAGSLHGKRVAQVAVLIYMTALHLVISNSDVRAEPYLTGLTIGSVYHFYTTYLKNNNTHLVIGSFLAACAVMTKGPFILITIGGGFIIYWIANKEWKQFLHYRWWIAILLVLLFITPEIYCLYLQFDAHPEKVVFNQTRVSGVRFFFYDSQFGRFFNSGPIKGKGDISFYFHTLLWAFLPWSLMLYSAYVFYLRNLKKRALTAGDVIIISTSLATFVLFSLSRFQLPHYMNIVFPFFSILTAHYLIRLQDHQTIRYWSGIQTGIGILSGLSILLITVLYRLPHSVLIIAIVIMGILPVYYFFRGNEVTAVFGRSFLTAVALTGFLQVFFYPALLTYQSGSEAARFINGLSATRPVCTYHESSYSFAFYLHQPANHHTTPESLKTQALDNNLLLFTRRSQLETLVKAGFQIKVLRVFPHFHISQLTGRFINHTTRNSVLDTLVVSEVCLPQNTR